MESKEVIELKETIEYFKNYLKASSLVGGGESTQDKMFRRAIFLFQQGEIDSKELNATKEELKKVWQMWNELYEIASEFNFFPFMDKIRQKFFHKE